jgi:hypothetical protein
MGGGRDFFAGYAVHTFAVQIPIASLNARNGTIGRAGRTAGGSATTWSILPSKRSPAS